MAAVTVNIDDNIYEHATALFAFRGKTVEEAVKEFFERAACDEEPVYTPIPLNAETIRAIEDAENGKNLIGPFDNMDDFWKAMDSEEEADA